jgi:hypothetical protein
MVQQDDRGQALRLRRMVVDLLPRRRGNARSN